jgi:glycerol-3-phosphate dehydrogenase subunit C
MREGSLEAPTRHPIDWHSPDFWDEAKLEAELRRVYDICHGCRRCFNLCDSFPKLFDFVDNAPNESVEDLTQKQLMDVVDGCTLCDMCFLTKCPYVPPHEWNLDFPHLMLRARAIETRKNGVKWNEAALTQTDRNGKLAALAAPIANWASKEDNALTRPLMEKIAPSRRR